MYGHMVCICVLCVKGATQNTQTLYALNNLVTVAYIWYPDYSKSCYKTGTGNAFTGERHKRQQAASLGVSPTLVARSHMSARSVAQQQVLTQRQQREGPAAVAQRAAADKLRLEQRALARDYEQLRQEQLRLVLFVIIYYYYIIIFIA